jgi:adenylate cyclase class 2
MEVEIKIPLKGIISDDKIYTRITEKFGEPHEKIIQNDVYFQNPIRDFWQSDEALRIRLISYTSQAKKVEMTYKGPKIGKKMKVRKEINIEVSDQKKAKSILESLGFQVVTTIRKKRVNWDYDNITISFDKIEDLGSFIEIEIESQNDHEEISKNKEKIMNIIYDLIPNYSGQDERRSYLELILLNHMNHKESTK